MNLAVVFIVRALGFVLSTARLCKHSAGFAALNPPYVLSQAVAQGTPLVRLDARVSHIASRFGMQPHVRRREELVSNPRVVELHAVAVVRVVAPDFVAVLVETGRVQVLVHHDDVAVRPIPEAEEEPRADEDVDARVSLRSTRPTSWPRP